MTEQDQAALAKALLAIVELVRDYLPPVSKITDKDFIHEVIGTVDNPEVNPVIAKLEGR